jgi:hypothetical protein
MFGAVPIYRYVAGKSTEGQGSIAMLQRLVSGWLGKFLVLILLGFAATDFVITITLSAADATEHLEHNPLWSHVPGILNHHLGLTNFMILLLGAVFLKGFKEAIGISVVLVVLFLGINLVVIACGLWTIITQPHFFTDWLGKLQIGELGLEEPPGFKMNWMLAILYSILLFPKLALGLSGFETGVAVMPLVKGYPEDTKDNPVGRIKNTRKLLLWAGLIMSFFLVSSSIVVVTLIPLEELTGSGHAANRALAYLAHGEGPVKLSPYFGEAFGTFYDVSTVLILWFAGASAMSGLLNLIPNYLPKYGMAPDWAAANKPLIGVIICTCLFVSIIFDASVEHQAAAYATGVMVLLLSACIAVSIDQFNKAKGTMLQRMPWKTLLILLIFVYTCLSIMIEKPEGLMISSFFIASIIGVSLTSRILRAKELRTVSFDFVDTESKLLWDTMKFLDIPVLAPHRPGGKSLDVKDKELRLRHHLTEDIPIVFVEVSLGDTSDFFQTPLLKITQEGGRFIIQVTRCTAIAPTLASICLELSKGSTPVEIHFGWSEESPLRMNLQFLLFGEGNVPWLVHDFLRRQQPDEALRPRVIIG